MVRKTTDAANVPKVTPAAEGETASPARRTRRKAADATPPATGAEDVSRPSFADAQRATEASVPPAAQQQRPGRERAAARQRSALEDVAHAAGQAFGAVRTTVADTVEKATEVAGTDAARGVIDFASEHKGKLVIAAGVVAAPTLAVVAGVAATGGALWRGAQHMAAGKSLPDAVTAVGNDVQDVADTAKAGWTAFKGLFAGKK